MLLWTEPKTSYFSFSLASKHYLKKTCPDHPSCLFWFAVFFSPSHEFHIRLERVFFPWVFSHFLAELSLYLFFQFTTFPALCHSVITAFIPVQWKPNALKMTLWRFTSLPVTFFSFSFLNVLWLYHNKLVETLLL